MKPSPRGPRGILLEDIPRERIELLLSWRNTGFSVHNTVTVEPEDPSSTERLARYLLRPSLSLERLSWDDTGTVSLPA